MKDKNLYLISCINDKKKEFLALFLWDVLSIFIVSIIFLISIYFICFLIKYLNFDFEPNIVIFYWFIIIWFIVAVLVSIVFHIKTICLLNKNGRGMLIKDEE